MCLCNLSACTRACAQGCKAHDDGLKIEGCWGTGPRPFYCSASWCYVDPALCPERQDECEAAGFKPGSTGVPACRARQMTPSYVLNASAGAFFSYETCGFQNKYDDNFLSAQIAGRHIKIGIPAFDVKPWVYTEAWPDAKQWEGWGDYKGVLVEKVDSVLQLPAPPLNLSLEAFGSGPSRLQHPLSSYTACCLDVMVGVLDLCVADFWVTDERLAMGVDFLYSFAADKMFLVAPHTEDPPTAADILRAPWLPFTAELWVVIVCYIVLVSAAVTLITDAGNSGDFDNNRLLARWLKASWLNAMGFVSRSIKNNPKSTPARVAAFGYGFFLLVTLQSWTAALASILVARNAKYGIRNFNDALDRNAKVCCLEAISSQVRATYPRGSYVIVGGRAEMHRAMAMGECDVGLVSEPDVSLLMSGFFNQDACDKEDAGMPGWERGASGCERDAAGKPTTTRDCRRFRDTGEVVMQIPLSMPANPAVSKAMSVQVARYLSEGRFDRSRSTHAAKVMPVSACAIAGGKQRSGANEAQLGVKDMVGTMLTALMFQLLALLLWACEKKGNKSTAELFGLASSPRHTRAAKNRNVGGAEGAHALEVEGGRNQKAQLNPGLALSARPKPARTGVHRRSFRRFDSSIGFFARADGALTPEEASQSWSADWARAESAVTPTLPSVEAPVEQVVNLSGADSSDGFGVSGWMEEEAITDAGVWALVEEFEAGQQHALRTLSQNLLRHLSQNPGAQLRGQGGAASP